jgi:hypothetical protein
MKTIKRILVVAVLALSVAVPAGASSTTTASLLVGAGPCQTSPSCVAFRPVCRPDLAPAFSVTSLILDATPFVGHRVIVAVLGSMAGSTQARTAILQTMSLDCAVVSTVGLVGPGSTSAFVVAAPGYLVLGAEPGAIGTQYTVTSD